MKTCQNCGAEIEQDALFCRECGTRLNNETTDSVNPELSRIIDLSLKYEQESSSIINTLLTPYHYQNTAAQLCIGRENGMLSLWFNVGLDFSDPEDNEILAKLRQSPYLSLFKPDDGYDINKGDLYGIIDFGNDIGKAKRTLSSLLHDVYNQDSHNTLDYLIQSEGQTYDCSEGYRSQRSSCMSVLAVFFFLLLLIVFII